MFLTRVVCIVAVCTTLISVFACRGAKGNEGRFTPSSSKVNQIIGCENCLPRYGSHRFANNQFSDAVPLNLYLLVLGTDGLLTTYDRGTGRSLSAIQTDIEFPDATLHVCPGEELILLDGDDEVLVVELGDEGTLSTNERIQKAELLSITGRRTFEVYERDRRRIREIAIDSSQGAQYLQDIPLPEGSEPIRAMVSYDEYRDFQIWWAPLKENCLQNLSYTVRSLGDQIEVQSLYGRYTWHTEQSLDAFSVFMGDYLLVSTADWNSPELSSIGTTYCLDLATGEFLWSKPVSVHWVNISNPLFPSEIGLVVYSGRVHCLDIRTGEELLSFDYDPAYHYTLGQEHVIHRVQTTKMVEWDEYQYLWFRDSNELEIYDLPSGEFRLLSVVKGTTDQKRSSCSGVTY